MLYFNFVRYSKIEEIYGWEKLDAVLETTASAVREFLDDDELARVARDGELHATTTTSSSSTCRRSGVAAATEGEITEMVTRLQRHVGGADRGGARRGHRGAVRHLRRARAPVLQPEDPARAADLSRHSRGGERVAIASSSASAARRVGRPARRASAIARSTSTTTRSSSPTTREIFGYEALARGAAAHAAQPRGDVRRRRRGGPHLGAEPALSRARARGHEHAPRAGTAALPQRRSARLRGSGVQRAAKSTTRRASSSRSRSARRSRTIRSSASGSRRSANAASASRSTTRAAATPGSARSPTSSPTSSSSTSR